MNKKTIKTVAIILAVQVIVAVVILVIGSSELIFFKEDGRVLEIGAMSQIEGGCIDNWGTDVCVFAGVNKSELYYCACVGSTDYCSCGYVFDDGCIRLSPSEQLDNLQMCASDYSKTSNSISVTTSAKACAGLLFWDICLPMWRQQLTFSR